MVLLLKIKAFQLLFSKRGEKNLESVNYFYKIKNYKIKVEISKKF